MESADSMYENVRSIRLGEGKRLWLYKGDEPFLAVDINIPPGGWVECVISLKDGSVLK